MVQHIGVPPGLTGPAQDQPESLSRPNMRPTQQKDRMGPERLDGAGEGVSQPHKATTLHPHFAPHARRIVYVNSLWVEFCQGKTKYHPHTTHPHTHTHACACSTVDDCSTVTC